MFTKTALLVEDGFPNGRDNWGTFDDVGVKNEYTHKKISLEANDAPGYAEEQGSNNIVRMKYLKK